jgi:hypothetical protein
VPPVFGVSARVAGATAAESASVATNGVDHLIRKPIGTTLALLTSWEVQISKDLMFLNQRSGLLITKTRAEILRSALAYRVRPTEESLSAGSLEEILIGVVVGVIADLAIVAHEIGWLHSN